MLVDVRHEGDDITNATIVGYKCSISPSIAVINACTINRKGKILERIAINYFYFCVF